jgi:RES domain-containing protein
MILWRLTKRRHADLSGRGGELFDARWHTRGRPIVYCATTGALSVLEVRVHLDLAPGLFPDDYVLMKANAPDDIDVHVLRSKDLPQGWRESEELCRPLGDTWLKSASTALLQVPSAILDVEANVLLNPKHPEAARVHIEEIVPFKWDRRLFEPRLLRS